MSKALTRSSPEMAQKRRVARMNRVDQFDPQTRSLIHEYGFRVVDAFVAIGVPKPRHIKHLVETVLDEFSPTRGTNSYQGSRRGKAWTEDPAEETGR